MSKEHTGGRARVSAGLVMHRRRQGRLEFFLAHPGGPFSRVKDEGHWTIPKGEPDAGEALLDVAKREFEEETGIKPHGPYLELGSIVQKGVLPTLALGKALSENRVSGCKTFNFISNSWV